MRCDEGGKRGGPAYLHAPGKEPLRMVTIGQLLDEAAEKWPNKEAVISHHEGKALTFQQAKEQAELLGAGLLRLGLKPGDKLALVGVNTIHWYISMLAAAKAGLITVMLNAGCRPQELRYALETVEAKCVVSDHKFKSQDYHEILAELVSGMCDVPHGHPVHCADLPHLSFVIVASDQKLPGSYRLEDIMDSGNDSEELRAIEEGIQPDDPVWILFSSGTTGKPKGAVLSHFGTINNVYLTGKRMGYCEKPSSICLQVPFYHIFGSSLGILSGVIFGNTLIMPGPIFNPQHTIAVLQKYKCEVLYGTSTMYIDICNELRKLFPTSSELRKSCANVEILMIGGSINRISVFKDMLEIFPNSNIVHGHGLTETSCICFLTYLGDSFEHISTTVGHLMEHSEVKIVDREGKMVEFETPGEAWFRSYGVLLEYWKNREKTEEVKTKTGWLKSGDIMILREDGYAKIVGRIKDVVIRGGENIFPTEIEEFLLQHPEISDAQVYGLAAERMGEEVAASIKLHKSNSLTENCIKEYCKGKISHFKIPKYIRFVDDYPLTPSGKVKKYQLREIHEKQLKGNV